MPTVSKSPWWYTDVDTGLPVYIFETNLYKFIIKVDPGSVLDMDKSGYVIATESDHPGFSFKYAWGEMLSTPVNIFVEDLTEKLQQFIHKENKRNEPSHPANSDWHR